MIILHTGQTQLVQSYLYSIFVVFYYFNNYILALVFGYLSLEIFTPKFVLR